MAHPSLKLIEFGLGGVMTIPTKQRERAARLFLMASDAYARGEPKLAELLIEESNECADRAAGVWSGGNRLVEPRRAVDDKEFGPSQAAINEIVENGAPSLAALAAHARR